MCEAKENRHKKWPREIQKANREREKGLPQTVSIMRCSHNPKICLAQDGRVHNTLSTFKPGVTSCRNALYILLSENRKANHKPGMFFRFRKRLQKELNSSSLIVAAAFNSFFFFSVYARILSATIAFSFHLSIVCKVYFRIISFCFSPFVSVFLI